MNRSWTLIGARLAALLALLGLLTTDVVRVDAKSTSDPPADRGLLRGVALEAGSGRALPVRVRVIPAGLLTEELVFQERTGSFEKALPSGEYRVVVSHGPAFTIHEQRVRVDGGALTTVHAELTREVDFAGYTGCDLHLHTSESPDSDLSVDERVSTLLAEDLSLAVLTDHNHVTHIEPSRRAGIAFLPGVEVTTWDPEFGHFNAFPVREAPAYLHTSEGELLAALRKNEDVFVQINHPRLETHIGYFELNGFEREGQESPPVPGFDGIEVWNGYELSSPSARQAVFLDWLAWNQRGGHAVATGGSDSHKRDHAPRAGYPRTYVRTTGTRERPEGVLSALKAGAAFVSNGPLIELEVDGVRPGEKLALHAGKRGLRVDVHVAAPTWMELDELEIWVGTELVQTLPLVRARSEQSFHLHALIERPSGAARTIVATVRGSGSMERLLGERRSRPYAFTNPVWLERH